MPDSNYTMVKARVGDATNEYIEHIQNQQDLNKQEATAYILLEAAERHWGHGDEGHRLAKAEPKTLPNDNDE